MTLREAEIILGPFFFCGYYGPGYTWRNAIEEMVRQHPRGEKGLAGKPLSYRRKFEAAFRIKQEMSNIRSSYGKH